MHTVPLIARRCENASSNHRADYISIPHHVDERLIGIALEENAIEQWLHGSEGARKVGSFIEFAA